MGIWIPITLAAAFLQNLRSLSQKQLKDRLGTTGATFARFVFGLPFGIVGLGVLHWGFGFEMPALNSRFIFAGSIAAFAQIAATALLISLFSYRNFAIGSVYARTEPLLAAFFGLVLLGEWLRPAAQWGIVISLMGVGMITLARTALNWADIKASLFSRSAAIGIASGMFFGLAAVLYRMASLALGGPNAFMQGGVTLLLGLTVQTCAMGLWIYLRERSVFAALLKNWKLGLLAGATGAMASYGWFTAMTLQSAALVKAVAQIELLFSFVTSRFLFGEAINKREILGSCIVAVGILVLLLWP